MWPFCKPRSLHHLEHRIMSALDDLQAAVADLTAKQQANHAAIVAEVDALKAALAAGDPATVEAIANNIKNITATMQGDTDVLTGSIAPAPAPTPPADTPPSDTPPA